MSDKSAPNARAHNLEILDHVTRVQPCFSMAENLKLQNSDMADGPMELLRQELQRAGFSDPEVEALLAQWSLRIRKSLKTIFKNIAIATYLRVQQGAPLTTDTLMECFDQVADQTEDHMVYVRDYRDRQDVQDQQDDQGNGDIQNEEDINRAEDQGADPEARGAEGVRQDNAEVGEPVQVENNPPVHAPDNINVVQQEEGAAINQAAQPVQPVEHIVLENVAQNNQEIVQNIPPGPIEPVQRIPIRRAIRTMSRVEPYYRPARYPGPHPYSMFGPYGPLWPPYPNFGPGPYPQPRRHHGPY